MRIETKPERAQGREPEGAMVAVRAAARLLAFAVFAVASIAATAQTPAPDAPPAAPTSTPAPAPTGTPAPAPAGTPALAPTGTPSPSEPHGFFDAFGNWVQQGVVNAGAGFGAMVGVVGGQATQAAKGAADAARSAATGVTKLPATGVIVGRERCTPAPNGAPDCRGAAEALCRAKGYVGGASVDFETVEKCPPGYRASSYRASGYRVSGYPVSGLDASEGVCTMEHFVTKALCQ